MITVFGHRWWDDVSIHSWPDGRDGEGVCGNGASVSSWRWCCTLRLWRNWVFSSWWCLVGIAGRHDDGIAARHNNGMATLSATMMEAGLGYMLIAIGHRVNSFWP